jgi:hypothetical protein
MSNINNLGLAFQAYDEGSIPFTRSIGFDGARVSLTTF